jgi:hypothetical protein
LAKIEKLAARIESDGAALSTNIPTHALVSNIANVQSLPERLVNYLLNKLGPPKDEFDSDPLAAARILACNAHFLGDSRRETVKRWLQINAPRQRRMSDISEALGCAASEWPLVPSQLAILVDQLPSSSRVPPREAPTEAAMVIEGEAPTEATIALGKVAQKAKLDPGLVDRLAILAASRTDLKSREAILLGLAFQWYEEPSAATIYARFASSRSDAKQRNLEIDVAATLLGHISPSRREAVAAEFTPLWRKETEPELRIAMARLLGSIDLAASGVH